MTTAQRPVPGEAREYHFPGFQRATLSSGVRVIVAPVRKLPIVTVLAVFEASAADDVRGLEGTAVLTAQAMREATRSRDANLLTLDLEKLGTSVEAGADWDRTMVSMTVLRGRLNEAFALFSEVLTEPAFHEKDIERLRGERLADRMQILSEPRELADESFTRFVYAPGARYGEPLAGTSATINAVSRGAITEFHARSFTPDAVTLIVAGDVGVDEAIAIAEQNLGGWKGTKDRRAVTADTAARAGRAVEIVAKPEAAQSELRIGHAGLPRSHPDYFDVVVMNAVLGGLFSSRINLNLREAHGYTYGASSGFDWRRQAGPFTISTAVQGEVTGAAVRETLLEIERMQNEEITVEELSLATSYLSGVFPIRFETTASIALALANIVTFGLPEDYYDIYRARIDGVTTGAVLRAARTHVKPDDLQLVVVGDPATVEAQVAELAFGPVSTRDGGIP